MSTNALDPNKFSRIRLFGKRVRNAELAKFVMTELGRTTQSELAFKLGTSRVTINALIDLGKSEGFKIEKQVKTPAELYAETMPKFLEIAEIKDWIQYMNGKARGGKPFAESAKRQYLVSFYQICDTLRMHPRQVLYGETINDVLDNGRKIMTEFMQHYKAGTAKVNYAKRKDNDPVNQTHAAYRYAKAIRDFMKSAGYQYPAGESGVMSQSITPFHGHYATVRIDEETHTKIKADLEAKYGRDSDEWLFYTYGIEAFPRRQSLLTTRTDFEELTQNNKRVLITKNYESKTSHYKKGIWTKYIFDESLQEIIKARKARGMEYLIEHRSEKAAIRYLDILQDLFRKHGLTSQGQRIDGDPETSYFIEHTGHSLRHAGAQRLLRATNWNVAFVAKRGWKKTQELIDSYGEMPPEIEAQTLGGVEF